MAMVSNFKGDKIQGHNKIHNKKRWNVMNYGGPKCVWDLK